MSKEPREPRRGRTVPAPRWWLDEIESRWDERQGRGETQETLAAEVESHLKVEPGEIGQPRISRALDGTTPTMVLVEALSSVLGVPPYVFTPRSVREAREMLAVRTTFDRSPKLASADSKLDEIRAGVAKIPKRRQRAMVSPRRGETKDRSRSRD